MEYDVFLSYSSKDIDFTEKLFLFLEKEGIHCCFIRKDEISQEEYENEVNCKIKESNMMVLLCPSYPIFNLSLLKEIALAHEENKPIIPFLVTGEIVGWFSSNRRYLNQSDLKLTTSQSSHLVKEIKKITHKLNDPWKNIENRYPVGSIHTGKVEGLSDLAVFVRLERGVQGIISVRNLSWGRRKVKPSNLFSRGDVLEAMVLKINMNKRRILLGYKQLTPDPWKKLDEAFKVGDHINGKVTAIEDYGAFVEITAGVEGLIHLREMTWSKRLHPAQYYMKEGDEVEAVILTIDHDKRRISLGVKQLTKDPWDNIEEKYPIGSIHSAKVCNVTNFAAFVEIEAGVEGLIHINEMSWTKKIKHPSEIVQIGDVIKFIVLDILKEKRSLRLGHKQLEENPWDYYESIYIPGSIHLGKIIEFKERLATIALSEGGEGVVTPKHLTKEDGTRAQLGEELKFKIIKFEKEKRLIVLSHSRTFDPRFSLRKNHVDTGIY